jgi:hypothetical protein
MKKIYSIIIFCLLIAGLLPQTATGKDARGPNISAIYRIEAITQQLPPLPDKQQLAAKESLPEAPTRSFIRLFGISRTLALEAGRLPAFQKEINEKTLLTLTRFTDLIENAQPEQKSGLESLLSIGIKESRRYSAPLEAVFWILEQDDSSQNKEILSLSLENLLDKAWNFSEKTRWQDYESVTERLNAPELINYYQRIRIIYISDKGKLNALYGDARNLFEKNSGNCYDHSAFASYCLEKAGYKTSVIGVHPSKPEYHVVCKYEIDGKSYYLDNGRPDKFLRRGIIPKEEYEMYREKENLRKGEGSKDPVYLLQDHHGLVLVYLMDQKEKFANVTTICKNLGLSGFEEKVKNEYLPELVKNGFITKPVYKSWISDDFEYKINEALSQKFKAARYHRPQNAAASW